MARLNKDSVIALVLLAFAGGAFWQTLSFRTRNDGIMRADAWPQAIIVFLAILSLIYLVQSLRAPGSRAGSDAGDATSHDGGEDAPRTAGIGGWLRYYANPLACFALYFVFLATLPWLGMLIGGTLLVFLTLTVLGGADGRRLLLHVVIAAGSIGFMWAVFTYGLRVSLPEGEILPLILPR